MDSKNKKLKIDSKAITAIKEFNNLNSIDKSIESLDLITTAYANIIQSIYKSKPDLKEGEVFIETLSIKIMLASKSIIQLTKGVNFNDFNSKEIVNLIDFPSINILTRSILEAFLTLEYLYFNDLKEDERKFRFYIWRVSGYKSRQSFFKKRDSLKKNVTDKLDSETKEIDILLNKIQASPFYENLNSHKLYKLDNYGLPRLNGWNDLITNGILKDSIFSTPYKLYSNYAHSEFISLIQMNVKDVFIKNSNENKNNLINSIRITKMINCVSITLLINKFDFANKVYETLDSELKNGISFWNKISIDDK